MFTDRKLKLLKEIAIHNEINTLDTTEISDGRGSITCMYPTDRKLIIAECLNLIVNDMKIDFKISISELFDDVIIDKINEIIGKNK